MTYSELVVEVTKDIGSPRKIQRALVNRVLSSFMKVTKRALLSDQKVTLKGFGAFYTVVPKKKELFGGRVKPRGKPVMRFKESIHGKRKDS